MPVAFRRVTPPCDEKRRRRRLLWRVILEVANTIRCLYDDKFRINFIYSVSNTTGKFAGPVSNTTGISVFNTTGLLTELSTAHSDECV